MEQHPIPRQITTFEFKLIGFMTLKQFVYLIVGFPLAYIVYILFPIPLLNILLGVLVAAGACVMAFVPIMDRSVDEWVKNVYKRLQNPTQYYYQKNNEPLYFLKDLYFLADPHHMIAHVESKEKLSEYLSRTRQKQRPNYRKKEIGTLLTTDTTDLNKKPVVSANPAPMPVPTTGITQPVVAQQAGSGWNMAASVSSSMPSVPPVVAQTQPSMAGTSVQPPIPVQVIPPAPEVPAPVTPQITAPDVPQMPVVPPQPSLEPQEAASQPRLQMVTEALEDPVKPQAPLVTPQIIPPGAGAMSNSAGTAGTTAPQLQSMPQKTAEPFFMGVVYNSKKIPIPGILVYVKDDQDKPMRLMKTNPHGVFATYSALPPNTYTFEIKDPNGTYFFDTMKLSVEQTNPNPFEFHSNEIL